jgi:hypothetical protein
MWEYNVEVNVFMPRKPSRCTTVHFGEAPVSDVYQMQRLQTIGEAMADNPGASIPQLFACPYDVKAA